MNYYFGQAYYELKSPDTACFYFDKIKANSPLFLKSSFFLSLNSVYTGNRKLAQSSLLVLNTDTSAIFNQQKQLMLCGIYLLDRNIRSADSLAALFTMSNYLFAEEQQTLKAIVSKLQHQKKKSPFMAALLSTAVPGLGKVYAGRKGQAFASFFSTLGIALISAENLYRGGIKSPQFIVSASVFSIFYLGNIVGSAYSVKMAKKQQALLVENEIKSALHKSFMRVFY